jgi:deazaflavin-dependent oxidoreductase (nitroreductase family)
MTGQALDMDVREVNKRVIEQFRAGGEIDGMHRERLVLLTTTGRRTGEPRTTPMMFHRDGDRVLVIASNIGAPRHPDWYLNLVAHPEVTVEVGDESGTPRRAVARTLEGDERTPVWEMLKATYPFFAEHERATARTIPVVALDRSGPAGS